MTPLRAARTPLLWVALTLAATCAVAADTPQDWLDRMNTALTTRNKAAIERDCPECLSSIPIGAKKCMYCTSEVPPVPQPREPTTDPRIGRMRHGAP